MRHAAGKRGGQGVLPSMRTGSPGGRTLPPSLVFEAWPRTGFTPEARPPEPGSRRTGRDRAKLRIANFVALSGSSGIWGPGTINMALLAAAEINRGGGILGREIELTFQDAGGDLDAVVERAAAIVAAREADVIMGSHISAVRVALRRVVAGRLPYVYTPVYEGGERTPGVMAIGETPRGQARPAIHWLAEQRRATRWYLIGSDYVWPWLSHRAIKRYIAESGGRVVGEEFVPMGLHDHEAQLARIRRAKPDVVLISLIGTHSITFNRAFAAHGLAKGMLRFACAMDETVLLGIGADNAENLYCASGYFSAIGSPDNDAFRARYAAAFGRQAPPPGSVTQSNYEGLQFLQAAASRAGTLDITALADAGRAIAYRGARGEVTIRDGSAQMPIYLAEADGLDFQVVARF